MGLKCGKHSMPGSSSKLNGLKITAHPKLNRITVKVVKIIFVSNKYDVRYIHLNINFCIEKTEQAVVIECYFLKCL